MFFMVQTRCEVETIKYLQAESALIESISELFLYPHAIAYMRNDAKCIKCKLYGSYPYRYIPVMLPSLFCISSGVPLATICPPASPPPGPMSIT